jgi:hypothetical protein
MDVTSAPICQFAQIGRYQRSELEAMHGQRGRKPAEYFELFPKRERPSTRKRSPKTARSEAGAQAVEEKDPLVERLRRATPHERLLLGQLIELACAPVPLSPSERIIGDDAVPPAVAPAPRQSTRVTRDLVALPIGTILDQRS